MSTQVIKTTSFIRGALLSVVAALALTGTADAVTIKEFAIGPGAAPGAHEPRYIHPGPDGNLWFTDGGTSAGIGRISTAGEFFARIPDPHRPVDLVVLPDGTIFWTADYGCGFRSSTGAILGCNAMDPGYAVALTSSGELHTTVQLSGGTGDVCLENQTNLSSSVCYAGTAVNATRLTGLALGADGRLWAAGYEENRLHRLTADATHYDLSVELPLGSGPARLALASDGNLWVTMYDASAIDRVTPTGARTRFALPSGRGPNDITVGPDGALWFTELKANKIGRMTTAGVLTNEYDVPTADSQPSGLTAGPDGAIWFTESKAGQIGRLQLDPTPGGGGGGGTGGGGSGPGSGGSRLSSLGISPHTVSIAGRSVNGRCAKATAKNAGHKTCRRAITLRISYKLTTAAIVTFTLKRQDSGRNVNGRCVRPTKANRQHKRCTRLTRVSGKITKSAAVGTNGLTFNGTIGGHQLAPGSYQVTAAPSHGTPRNVTFRIVG